LAVHRRPSHRCVRFVIERGHRVHLTIGDHQVWSTSRALFMIGSVDPTEAAAALVPILSMG
jgi:hypothetical protein